MHIIIFLSLLVRLLNADANYDIDLRSSCTNCSKFFGFTETDSNTNFTIIGDASSEIIIVQISGIRNYSALAFGLFPQFKGLLFFINENDVLEYSLKNIGSVPQPSKRKKFKIIDNTFNSSTIQVTLTGSVKDVLSVFELNELLESGKLQLQISYAFEERQNQFQYIFKNGASNMHFGVIELSTKYTDKNRNFILRYISSAKMNIDIKLSVDLKNNWCLMTINCPPETSFGIAFNGNTTSKENSYTVFVEDNGDIHDEFMSLNGTIDHHAGLISVITNKVNKNRRVVQLKKKLYLDPDIFDKEQIKELADQGMLHHYAVTIFMHEMTLTHQLDTDNNIMIQQLSRSVSALHGELKVKLQEELKIIIDVDIVNGIVWLDIMGPSYFYFAFGFNNNVMSGTYAIICELNNIYEKQLSSSRSSSFGHNVDKGINVIKVTEKDNVKTAKIQVPLYNLFNQNQIDAMNERSNVNLPLIFAHGWNLMQIPEIFSFHGEFYGTDTVELVFDQSKISTVKPSTNPTIEPTLSPSYQQNQENVIPTESNWSKIPTYEPTLSPTESPTYAPTFGPTGYPIYTFENENSTTNAVSITPHPETTLTQSVFSTTQKPSATPEIKPVVSTTNNLAIEPSKYVGTPTINPTQLKLLEEITKSSLVSLKVSSLNPTRSPSKLPSISPSKIPTIEPTFLPSISPSKNASSYPTIEPLIRLKTDNPTTPVNTKTTPDSSIENILSELTISPTGIPTEKFKSKSPTVEPTISPSSSPNILLTTKKPFQTTDPFTTKSDINSFATIPTENPSFKTISPTLEPTITKSSFPTVSPSFKEVENTETVSIFSLFMPSYQPTTEPTVQATEKQGLNLTDTLSDDSQTTIAPTAQFKHVSRNPTYVPTLVRNSFRQTNYPTTFPTKITNTKVPTQYPTFLSTFELEEQSKSSNLIVGSIMTHYMGISLRINETSHEVTIAAYGPAKYFFGFGFSHTLEPVYEVFNKYQMYSIVFSPDGTAIERYFDGNKEYPIYPSCLKLIFSQKIITAYKTKLRRTIVRRKTSTLKQRFFDFPSKSNKTLHVYFAYGKNPADFFTNTKYYVGNAEIVLKSTNSTKISGLKPRNKM